MSDANDGIIELNPAPFRHGEVIIVSGLPRSGTSMCAHVLHEAGVPMGGSEMNHVVFEDQHILSMISRGDTVSLAAAVATRHPSLWGFKAPGLFQSPAWTHPMQNAIPLKRYVLMVRDPVAVAVRSGMAEGRDVRSEVLSAGAELVRCLDFAMWQTCPVLLVSYEKALAKPLQFIWSLLDFVGHAVLRPRDLAALIQPERPEYVRNARQPLNTEPTR